MAAAGNEWINGYLEAILDAGVRLRGAGPSLVLTPRLLQAPALADAAAYSPTKYFVEEVVSRFDDRDLHKTWTKVVAMRSSQERNNRLENLCWRIWHVGRKKKEVEWEYSRQLARRRLEQEVGSREAAEELSEGEKDRPSSADGDHNQQSRFARINSEAKIVSDDEDDVPKDERNLYIVLISIHGLVRGENMELGRDSDTGGQVKYVVELARALAATAGVHRVDLLTRQICCPDVDWTYGEPVEMITRPSDADDSTVDGGGAYIVRLPCGPRDKYLPKESLWPHIPEFVDRALAHVTNVARALGDHLTSAAPVWPYVIHGHYADAAEVAASMASALNVPMVMTGHSLGRNKLEQLLKLGRMPRAEIQGTYRIARRVEAEETGLDAAEVVVTSTKQEIEEQWGLYDGFDVMVERKLRVRRRRGVSCLGRYMPRMVVIPPGMDFSYVDAGDLADGDGDLQTLMSPGKAKKPLPPIWSEVLRFFTNPHKPMILALSRPDPKKNVTTLLKAYGESRHLRELANLTLILGNRDDIEEMPGGAATVLTAVLKLIDRYDLYGQVAYPKHHKQTDVPHIYRLAAKTKVVRSVHKPCSRGAIRAHPDRGCCVWSACGGYQERRPSGHHQGPPQRPAGGPARRGGDHQRASQPARRQGPVGRVPPRRPPQHPPLLVAPPLPPLPLPRGRQLRPPGPTPAAPATRRRQPAHRRLALGVAPRPVHLHRRLPRPQARRRLRRRHHGRAPPPPGGQRPAGERFSSDRVRAREKAEPRRPRRRLLLRRRDAGRRGDEESRRHGALRGRHGRRQARVRAVDRHDHPGGRGCDHGVRGRPGRLRRAGLQQRRGAVLPVEGEGAARRRRGVRRSRGVPVAGRTRESRRAEARQGRRRREGGRPRRQRSRLLRALPRLRRGGRVQGEEGELDPAVAADARVPMQPRVHARLHPPQRRPALRVAAPRAQVPVDPVGDRPVKGGGAGGGQGRHGPRAAAAGPAQNGGSAGVGRPWKRGAAT